MNIDQVMRRLRLRDLDTLRAVVQAGGIRKAAEQLHRSQPAVSKAIAELERTLGVTLLERGRRGVSATSFGELLITRSRAVFDELQGTLRELDQLADPRTAQVNLGCMETLHAGLVGATVQRLLQDHPRMRFVLESGQGDDLISYFLMQRRVEFVVARPLVLPLPPEVHGEPLFHDRLRVVVGHAHPFARRRRIGLADLADECWILSRNESMAQSPVAEAFLAAGLPMPERRVLSGSLNTRYNLLNGGRFVTVVPHSLLPFANHRAQVRQLPVDLPVWHTPTMIMTLRGRMLSPAVQLFLATLRRMAVPLAAGG